MIPRSVLPRPITALASVLVAAAMLFLLGSCSSGASSANEVDDQEPAETAQEAAQEAAPEATATALPTATAVPTSTPTPTPTPGVRWTNVTSPDMTSQEPFSNVNHALNKAKPDGRWMFFGSIKDPTTDVSTAATWEARGLTGWWKRIDVPPLDPTVSETMNYAVRFGDAEIAAGQLGRNLTARPAIWVRPEDGTWDQIVVEAFPDEPSWISDLASGDSGLLAVVTNRSADGKNVDTMWISEDGIDWIVIRDETLWDEHTSIRDIAVGDERFVAAGSRPIDGDPASTKTEPVFWVSEDGRTWEEAPMELDVDAEDGGEFAFVDSVARWTIGFVAVGSISNDGVSQPASWTSDTGEVWKGPFTAFATADNRNQGGGYGASGIVRAADRLLAHASSSFMQQVWTSSNGRDWRPVGSFTNIRSAGVSIGAMAGSGTAVILGTGEPAVLTHLSGWVDDALERDVLPRSSDVRWISDIVASTEGFHAVGGLSRPGTDLGSTAMSWFSSDGGKWVAEELPSVAQTGSILDVAATSGGVAALIRESIQHNATSSDFLTAAVLLRSDGQWSVLDVIQDEATHSYPFALTSMTDPADLDTTPIVAAVGVRFSEIADAEAGVFVTDGSSRFEPMPAEASDATITATCSSPGGSVVTVMSSPSGTKMLATRTASGPWTLAGFDDDADADSDVFLGSLGCDWGPDGFILSGSAGQAGSTVGALWTSADGLEWQRRDLDVFAETRFQYPVDIATTETTNYLVGYDWDSGFRRPILWVGSGEDYVKVPLDFGSDRANEMGSLQVSADGDQVIVSGYQTAGAQVFRTTQAEIDAYIEAIGG